MPLKVIRVVIKPSLLLRRSDGLNFGRREGGSKLYWLELGGIGPIERRRNAALLAVALHGRSIA